MAEDTFHFQVERGELAGVRLENAYMLSRRGWPIEGTISIDADAGRFSCSIRHAGGTAPTAQLVVQVALESIGVLKLRTTLLPPREEPYDFMLELARERIRHFLQKCEDWQMFAPAVALEAREHFDTARGLLARAVLETDCTVASQLAREAIVDAVKAGELLAARYADLILHRRFAKSAASSTTLGVRIDPRSAPPKTTPKDLGELGVMMIETPWSLVQPDEGEFDFDAIDRWVEWGNKHHWPIMLGPLLDLRPQVVPSWVAACAGDYQVLCKLVWEHQEKIVSRYAPHVAIWCVASGIHVNRLVRLDHDQMIDLTRRSAVLVRQARRSAKVLVELVQPFSDDVARFDHSVPAYEYAVRTLDEGVHVDCFGLRICNGFDQNGCEVRDLLSLSDAVDHFGRLERPLMLTGIKVPREGGDLKAGMWHEPWDSERQARWAATMFGIALGKMTSRTDATRNRPVGVVEGVLWDGMHDGVDGSLAGLLQDNGAPNAVLQRLAGVRRALRVPLGKSNLKAADFALDPDGVMK